MMSLAINLTIPVTPLLQNNHRYYDSHFDEGNIALQ